MEGFEFRMAPFTSSSSSSSFASQAHAMAGKRVHEPEPSFYPHTEAQIKRRRTDQLPVSPGSVSVMNTPSPPPLKAFLSSQSASFLHLPSAETIPSSSYMNQLHSQEQRCFVCEKPYASASTTAPIQQPFPSQSTVMPKNALLQYFAPIRGSPNTVKHPQMTVICATSISNANRIHCHFCERSNCCPDCWRTCQQCQHNFCAFCSTMSLSIGRIESTFCLDCLHHVQQKRVRDDEDAMQCG